MNKWVDSLHPINIPKQLWFHIGMHRVQDKIHPLQAVRKVLARLKYSVPLYKDGNSFSILTEECLTFRTVSLSSGQFVSRNKIGISRKQDYFVNKTLKGQRGYNLTGIENKNWYPSEATEPVLIVP